jgi:hypothetical protein
MKPATPKARALLVKLAALAERGINGEKANARRSVARLRKRYDFDAPDTGGSDVFAGGFIPSTVAAPVIRFEPADFDIANSVKWAIESSTKIRCLFRGGELLAEAAPPTANRLHDIAGQLSAGFSSLWAKFAASPGANASDRGNFIAGLYDGMMNEVRTNTPLPSRAARSAKPRAKAKALASLPGIGLHPYSVAVGLGRQVRFSVPLETIAAELEAKVAAQIEGVKP